jgi:hypothetical protein
MCLPIPWHPVRSTARRLSQEVRVTRIHFLRLLTSCESSWLSRISCGAGLHAVHSRPGDREDHERLAAGQEFRSINCMCLPISGLSGEVAGA